MSVGNGPHCHLVLLRPATELCSADPIMHSNIYLQFVDLARVRFGAAMGEEIDGESYWLTEALSWQRLYHEPRIMREKDRRYVVSGAR